MAAPLLSALEEIVVTATRRAATTDHIAAAVSVVNSDEVRRQKLTTDALASEVGVYLQQTTPGQGAAIIRGLKGSAILHLVDGMPLSNALFRSAPTPYLAYVPTTAVERIEIVRGTPASLYGSQAVGGVVQVVSRIPRFDTDKLAWKRSFAVGLDTAELQKSLKGTVDFGHRQLAASVSAEYLTTGNRQTGAGERVPQSGYESKATRFVLSATPDDNKSWLLDLQFLEQPETPRVDELVPGFGQSQPS
jgi:outer membrane cobalamin receptor